MEDNRARTDDAHAAAVIEEMRRTHTIVPPRLRGDFTVRYVVALVAVAALTVLLGWFGIRQLEIREGDGAEINVAGRQRMLSQRIALLAGLFVRATANEDTPAAERQAETLRATIAEMRNAQRALLEGNAARGLPGTQAPSVLALYDGGVRDTVQRYLEAATAVLEAESSEARAAALADVQRRAVDSSLLDELNLVVSAYEDVSQAKLVEMGENERRVIALMLLVLILEAVLVFRPMSQRILAETARLREAAARHETDARRHEFGLRLRDAVELADDEADVIDAVGLAHARAIPENECDLLLAKPEEPGRLAPVMKTSRACGVRAADACPALRRGRAVTFSTPVELGACNQLRRDALAREDTNIACACVPLTFLGQGIGVVRTVSSDTLPPSPDDLTVLETVASVAGSHLGTLRAFASTRAAADRDPMTGLLNRRGLDAELARLNGQEICVIAIDLDHFKRVNDEHGHEAGDRVLIEAAASIKAEGRPVDLVARIGGEEFVVVISQSTTALLPTATSLAERIRSSFAAMAERASGPACTASLGVAGPGAVFANVLRQADLALYRAKDGGRNRVVTAGDPEGASGDVEVLPRPSREPSPATE
ncbi:MAG: diguanylate cyclase [Myxococcota bacterium]